MATDDIRTLLPRLRDLVARPDARAEDRELLRRFSAERDEAAFAEIVRCHGPMLLRVCRRALRNGPDAEDVCQAAFLLLARKANSVRWHDSVAGWLFQTAHRLSRKVQVAAARRARHEARARPARPAEPSAELTARELQEALDEEVSLLPGPYRAAIVLCCLEGRSRDEAASCLGWRLATVKDRLERGRERLRARLARRGVLLGTALTSAWLLEGPARAGISPHAAAKAALLLVTGQAGLAELLPGPVAALAKGGTTTMALCRVTMLAAGLALALGAAAGVTKTAGGVEGQPPAKAADKPAQPKPPADTRPAQPEALPLAGHRGAVSAVAFGPDGRAVATAGDDKTVRVWDTASGLQLHSLEQPEKPVAVAISPDGRSLAALSRGRAGALGVWDTATGKAAWRSGQWGPAAEAGTVAFSPDGRMIAEGLSDALLAMQASSGRIFFSMKGPGGEQSAVAFSPDGKTLASGGGGGNVQLVDAATGRLVRVWRGKSPVIALAFVPAGNKVAVADASSVRLLDLATGNDRVAFAAKPPPRAVAFSPDGRRLATAGGDGAVLWDLTRDEKPLPKDFKLTEAHLKSTWADLASDEGSKAYAAARMLRADPARAVPFLRDRLEAKPATLDEKRLEQLLAELDADEFAKREAATKELGKLGYAAEAAMRQALAAGPSPEVKRRLERLLKPLVREGKALTAEQQRDVRAVRVLEQAGTPEARRLLEALSKESPGWWVTQEAKEALERQSRRDKRP